MTQRALDHIVLPTASLAVARARLASLGFTVAPEGVHPFGTSNVCVYFPGGTFIESLALRDGAAAAEAIEHGNVFVARDHVYRAMRGEDGFSAIVLASDDADRDHDAFAAADISGGDMLTFSRPAADPSGKVGTASFRLAFASDIETPDAFLFTCQRVNVPAIDRSSLERHANGATAMSEIIAEPEGSSFIRLLERAAGGTGHDTTHSVELTNVRVRLARRDDPAIVAECGHTLSAAVFAVADLSRTRAVFDAGDVAYEADGHRIVVPPAPGQGATFIFREQS